MQQNLYFVIFSLTIGPKVMLMEPCVFGDVCLDSYAQCRGGYCQCNGNFMVINNRCGKKTRIIYIMCTNLLAEHPIWKIWSDYRNGGDLFLGRQPKHRFIPQCWSQRSLSNYSGALLGVILRCDVWSIVIQMPQHPSFKICRCHAKRRIGGLSYANPCFGMMPTTLYTICNLWRLQITNLLSVSYMYWKRMIGHTSHYGSCMCSVCSGWGWIWSGLSSW